MRYLLLNSLAALALMASTGCRSVYRNLQPAEGDIITLDKFKPAFERALYTTRVDVAGNHLSGLLLMKVMPDSSLRIVFSNEMGFKFFDFEFSYDGKFKVYYILKQMNKKAVIKTLRKEFELVLMRGLDAGTLKVFKQDSMVYYRFKMEKGYNYYITNADGSELIRMEKSSARKPVAIAIMRDYYQGMPDTIGISHKKFNFEIGLKRTEN